MSWIRLAASLLILSGHSFALAQEWRVLGDSSIGFVATYDSIPFEGRFRDFEADIVFNPELPEESAFRVEIDMGSVDTRNRDRDDGIRTGEWFAVSEHPRANFVSTSFRSLGDSGYLVTGTLTIKDVTRTVDLPFRWQGDSSGHATLDIDSELNRNDFNIGTGDWQSDPIIGFSVQLRVRLLLCAQTGAVSASTPERCR